MPLLINKEHQVVVASTEPLMVLTVLICPGCGGTDIRDLNNDFGTKVYPRFVCMDCDVLFHFDEIKEPKGESHG